MFLRKLTVLLVPLGMLLLLCLLTGLFRSMDAYFGSLLLGALLGVLLSLLLLSCSAAMLRLTPSRRRPMPSSAWSTLRPKV